MAKRAAHSSQLSLSCHWNQDRLEFEIEWNTTQMFYPCMGDDSNANLTNPQRELLLWHWKLGMSMSRAQQLMVEHEAIDANNKRVIMSQVIKPNFPFASSCSIPLCTSCQLAQAQQRKPGVTKQKYNEEREGICSANALEPGDFVSMDHFIVKTPGRLPTG